MSHCPGKVVDATGDTIGWFEYSDTVDCARTQIFTEAYELEAAWREPQPEPCACAGVPVRLIVWDLQDWDAKVCLEHHCIVEGRRPPDV